MKSSTILAPTFLEGVALALIAALAGTLTYSALGLVLPGTVALRLIVAALGLGYLLYLLGRSRERIGRLVTIASWLTLAGLLWLSSAPLSVHLLVHLAMVWVARSLYFHQGPLPALADLGLTGFALVAGLGTYLHTGSLFLSLWSLFLVQALFVFIPSRAARQGGEPADEEDGFGRAYQAAEAAVRRLSTTQ